MFFETKLHKPNLNIQPKIKIVGYKRPKTVLCDWKDYSL